MANNHTGYLVLLLHAHLPFVRNPESLYEPFGIVALEAMSAGVPVIVARTGGLAEVVEDGVTGLVFNPERDYTWAAVARQTLSLYQELLRERSLKGG